MILSFCLPYILNDRQPVSNHSKCSSVIAGNVNIFEKLNVGFNEPSFTGVTVGSDSR